MKQFTTFLFTLFICTISAQQVSDFEKYSNRKNAIESKSMVALGTWAFSNIAVGTYQAVTLPESSDKYFHRMNATWNAINLPIAIAGYIATMKHKTAPDIETLKKQQRKVELALLINSGLDVGYIGVGLWMNLAADRAKNPELNLGFGNSIMLQGSYLLTTDLVQYTLHKINQRKNFKNLQKTLPVTDF